MAIFEVSFIILLSGNDSFIAGAPIEIDRLIHC